MTDHDIHEALVSIADRSRTADLYRRSLTRSRQLGRRRTVAAVVTTVLSVLMATAAVWQLIPPTAAPTTAPTPLHTVTGQPTQQPPIGAAYRPTITYPAWPVVGNLGGCLTGTQDFRNKSVHGHTIHIDADATAHIGGEDAIILIMSCYGPGSGRVQLAAAYRVLFDGTYSLIGSMVATGAGGITNLGFISSPGDDRVTVQTGSQLVPGDSPPDYAIVWQNRTYTFDGRRFAQTDGPRTFVADPATTRVSVTVSPLVFGPAVNGCRTGTMTVKVRNTGAASATGLTAVAFLDRVPAAPDSCDKDVNQGFNAIEGPVGPLDPGASAEVLLTVTAGVGDPIPSSGYSPEAFVQLMTNTARVADGVPFRIDYPTA